MYESQNRKCSRECVLKNVKFFMILRIYFAQGGLANLLCVVPILVNLLATQREEQNYTKKLWKRLKIDKKIHLNTLETIVIKRKQFSP